jgi:type II secretory ATPase GspE/PulE/Tfp pilus assembly ATPase PilB-like protein
MNDTYRGIINQGVSSENLKQAFFKSDSPTLFDDGIEKVKQGITTVDEVLRVTEVRGHQD